MHLEATRRSRTLVFLGAVAAGSACIALATRYTRAEPQPASDPPGLTFTGSNGITVANDAPAWSSLAVDHPSAAVTMWTDPVSARITFDEARTSRVATPLAGRVTSVYVQSGQAVKKGAPLYTITSSGLAELKSEVAKTDVELKTAQIELDRTKALVDAGSLPGKELVGAQQRVAEAQLAGQLARQKVASLAVANGTDATFTVSAPRDGVVVEKKVAVGMEVDASVGTLVAVADLSSVWVLVDLFEEDVGDIKTGAEAKVVFDGANEVTATVDQVSAVVDPDRHTVPVRIHLDNPAGALRPNAHAEVRLKAGTAPLALPSRAVLSNGRESYVYVVGPGGAMARRTIKIGPSIGDLVPVLDGVTATDKIVVKGAILLDNAIALHAD